MQLSIGMAPPNLLLSPLAITEEGFGLVLALCQNEELFNKAQAAALEGRELTSSYTATVIDGIAHIPIKGTLFNKSSVLTLLMSAMGGASTYAAIGHDFQVALDDPGIRGIVFEVDSPGGDVSGCSELSSLIYSSRGKKPITANVIGECCSAAYWLASSCDRIMASPTSILGSIGVRSTMIDDSKRDEMHGIKEYNIVSSQSPYKVADASKAEDRDREQALLTELAAVFIADVARGRGVSAEYVTKNFGRGDCFIGQSALSAGLCDAIATSGVPKTIGESMTTSQPLAKMHNAKCDSCESRMDMEAKTYCESCYSDVEDGDEDGDEDEMASATFAREAMALIGVTDHSVALGALAGLIEQAKKADEYAALVAKADEEKKQAAKEAAISNAISAGKIDPAKRADAEAIVEKYGADALAGFLAITASPSVPAIEKRDPKSTASATAAVVDPAIKAIIEATGVSPEAMTAHKAKLAKLLKNQEEN